MFSGREENNANCYGLLEMLDTDKNNKEWKLYTYSCSINDMTNFAYILPHCSLILIALFIHRNARFSCHGHNPSKVHLIAKGWQLCRVCCVCYHVVVRH